MSMLKRVKLNRKFLAVLTTKFITLIYAVLGLIGTLAPLDEILPETLSVWNKAVISLAFLAFLWCVCFVVIACYNVNKKRFALIKANSGHCLYLQYGDLFDQEEVLKPDERRNIVIPVNRCFDTIVDNRLVSETTIHGTAFKKLYAANSFTEETLNQTIQGMLSTKVYEQLSVSEKPAGNRKRYPAGTIVDLAVDSNTHYFLWALSTFDNELHAHTPMRDYAIAVQQLVESCNSECEGYPVVMPLGGAGLSRTDMSQQDIMEYLIEVFRVNRAKIKSDIHIVVRDDLKNDVSIMDLT